jgi:hypothetical protein
MGVEMRTERRTALEWHMYAEHQTSLAQIAGMTTHQNVAQPSLLAPVRCANRPVYLQGKQLAGRLVSRVAPVSYG